MWVPSAGWLAGGQIRDPSAVKPYGYDQVVSLNL